MNQKKLSDALSGVVEDSVNKVGVDLNTASASLLEYVSGINKTIAKNIVDYRENNGRFVSRKQLLKVPKLGPKAYEQCAGFLRIPDGKNPLDATSVHPESYEAAEQLMAKLGLTMDPDERLPRILSTPSYTAYLKIADGCDNNCTYCAIPMIRGHFRSRKIEDIVEEAENLAKNGVKELILIAQDTSRYGKDLYGEYSLDKLLEKLVTVDGINKE